MSADKNALLGKVNIDVQKEIKNHMKSQASIHDVPIPTIWEEAALMFLKTKGIILNLNSEQTDNQISANAK